MPTSETLFAVNLFILDTCEVAARLDAVNRQQCHTFVSATARKGRDDLEALRRRRQALPLSPRDASLIQTALDGIEVRLRLLEKWE